MILGTLKKTVTVEALTPNSPKFYVIMVKVEVGMKLI